jgi:hypothetical protein
MKTLRLFFAASLCLAAPMTATAQNPERTRATSSTRAADELGGPGAVPAPANGDAPFEGFTIEMMISELPSESLRAGSTLEGTAVGSTAPAGPPPTPDPSSRAIRSYASNLPPGVKVLAAPKVLVMPRESITVDIAASQSFTYLESEGPGRYVARQSEPQKLGMKISVKADPSPDDASVVLCRLECETSALVGREPVKGLDLDVGRPIVSSWSLKTTAAAKLRTPVVVFLPSGPNRTCLLTLVVNNQLPKPEEGTPILPKPSTAP